MMKRSPSSECPHCGHILGVLTPRYRSRHTDRCGASHPAERKYFKKMGYFPKKGSYPKWVREEMRKGEKDG